jgi:branched-chain amino acid transport system substrate-binding protein
MMKTALGSRATRVVSAAAILLIAVCSCPPTLCAADPVKVGFATSLTGVFSAIGEQMRDGFSLYMEQIASKAGGREIKVIVQDIGSNQVNRAVQEVGKLIEQDKIDVLAGVVDSGSAYALARLTAKEKIPFIISNAGADDLTQRKNTPFILRANFGSNSTGSHAMGAWAYEQGFRKAATIGADYAAGYESIGGACRTFKAAGGKILQEAWLPVGTQDFKPALAKISPEADLIIAFFGGKDAERFMEQYIESGLKDKIPVVGQGALTDELILAKVGKAAEGIVTEWHWSIPMDNPENKAFVAAFKKKHGRNPTVFAEEGYVTAMVVAEALNKTGGQFKGEEFVKAAKGLELKGPRGSLKFDAYGAPVHTVYLRKVQNVDGEWQNVNFKAFPNVSQFWKWTPEEFLKMEPYDELKGTWTK